MGILLDSIEAFLFCFFHGSQIIIAGLKWNDCPWITVTFSQRLRVFPRGVYFHRY